MIRRITILSLVLLAVLLIATPVLAYLYRAQVSITESNGTDYGMLGVMWDQSNIFMAENDYMESDALDTRVQTLGGTDRPHMVAVDQTLTASPIAGNSQTNYYFVTGESDLTDVDVIVGDGGSITTLDVAALEPGDDFSLSFTGWIGDNPYIIDKDNSFSLSRSGTDVTATIENMTSFPNVSATSNGQSAGAGGVGNYPAGIVAGDLVIVTAVGQTGTTLTLDAELTELWKSGSAPIAGSYYRIIDGTEGATFTYVADAGNTGYVAYRIDRETYYGVPEVGTEATATSANPNSPSVSPTFGAVNALWIATYGKDNVAAINAWPANYAGSQVETANHYAAICTRDLAAASEDPGAWTLAAGATWIANTIVVRAHPAIVTATGVADDEYAVLCRADVDIFDFLVDYGDVLHLNGGATNVVNCGAIHNNQAKFWVFLRFELDSTFQTGVASRQDLIHKYINGTNYIRLQLDNTTGCLTLGQVLGGVSGCYLTSTTATWTAGQVYEVLASVSDTAGGTQRLLVNGSLEDSGTTAAQNLPNGGNFLIGYYQNDSSMIIHDVVVGTDDLLVAEETAMFAGDFPADAVNLWHLDDGAGTTAYDLGTGGNDGTIGAGCTWEAGQRYTDFYLSLDGTSWGVNTDGLSCGDSSEDWVLYPDPYWTAFLYQTFSGGGDMFYNPNDIVRGLEYDTGTVTVTNGDATVEGAGGATWTDSMTGGIFVSTDGEYYVIDSITDSDTLELATVYGGATLAGQNYDMYPRMPDRSAPAQDGAVTWGGNPAGVSVSIGSMVSSGQGVVGEEEETPTKDILPPAGTTDWAEDPDVSGSLLTNPMRPIVVAVSDNTSLSERQVWVYFGLILLLLVTAGVARVVHGHHLITGIAAAAIVIALSVMTIWPLWALVFAALAVVGGLVAERSPSL